MSDWELCHMVKQQPSEAWNHLDDSALNVGVAAKKLQMSKTWNIYKWILVQNLKTIPRNITEIMLSWEREGQNGRTENIMAPALLSPALRSDKEHKVCYCQSVIGGGDAFATLVVRLGLSVLLSACLPACQKNKKKSRSCHIFSSSIWLHRIEEHKKMLESLHPYHCCRNTVLSKTHLTTYLYVRNLNLSWAEFYLVHFFMDSSFLISHNVQKLESHDVP